MGVAQGRQTSMKPTKRRLGRASPLISVYGREVVAK
jgi:hypothetical protein